MTVAQSRIKKDIDQLKADEHQIHQKLMWFSQCDEHIDWRKEEIKYLEAILGKVELRLPMKFSAENNWFRMLDRSKRWPMGSKRLIKKDRKDMDYLEQVQEELLSSKKSTGMTSCGTRDLNHLIGSMEHGIRHGNKNRADEMKMYSEIRNVMETREVYNAPEPDPPSYWYPRERLSKRDIDSNRFIQHKIKIRLDEIEKIERDLTGRKRRVKRLKSELEFVRKNISHLQKELQDVTSKRLKAYERAYELGEQKKELKLDYKEYQLLRRYAKSLARKRDVVELKQACDTQVEGFMRQWNDSQVFRNDYERRKLFSVEEITFEHVLV
ncbi:proton pump-interactor BIP131-like [Cynara cardunculus var. scolymus]|uniref:proton pump-interactor BIP131-like n=1 Tax=Cynara cardunculus var. scolymus TaxID=59895 RepID=UPI000D626FF2|nr:proton pump-interactor BIP131-like [Cynara cardunculus var. scolymus]